MFIELKADRQAEIIKALSHPSRITILRLLERGERCVQKLMAAIPGSQPNTSKHLFILKDAGILSARKEGTRVLYRIADTRAYEILELTEEMLKKEHRFEIGATA
jgi:DNA-binding transcriptional ArsR family regulator